MYTKRVRHTRTMKMKQNQRWGGRTEQGERGRILPVYIEGSKPSSRYWFLGITSNDMKESKTKTFQKQFCSYLPWKIIQTVLLKLLPVWAAHWESSSLLRETKLTVSGCSHQHTQLKTHLNWRYFHVIFFLSTVIASHLV